MAVTFRTLARQRPGGGCGRRFLALVVGLVAPQLGTVTHAENNSTNVITTATNAGSLYIVGHTGTLNDLQVRGPGGSLTDTNGIIGLTASAGTNSATVTGSGARWISIDTLYVGLTGSVSRLTVTNAGVVTNDIAYIGYDENSRRNSALVTGANSRWRADDLLVVGYAGSDNSLAVSNNAVVSCGFDSYIGGSASAANNTVIVTGAGSQWNSDGGLYVGYSGAGSRLFISSGGVVSNDFGVIGSFASSNNSVTVTGAGAAWKMPGADLIIGDSQSSGSQLTVTNGGLVTSLTARFGSEDAVGHHVATVTGGGSRWLVGDALCVGDLGGLNQLLIQAGGLVTNLDAIVGSAASGSGNYVAVSGTGSFWTNRNLTVGREGSWNHVAVQNGSGISCKTNTIGLARTAGSNSVWISGTGSRSVTAQDCFVGYAGCDNRLSVSGGARADHSSTWVGLTVDSCNNTLWLADSGTVLSNAFALEIAFDGTGNGLVITNGAMAMSSFGRVSTYGLLTRAVVTGTNSSWLNSGDLYVGQVGAGTQLNIENGGNISNLDGYAGVYNFGTTVAVTGPGSRWSNFGDLYVNFGGTHHQLIISNGAVVTNVNGYVGVSEASTDSAVQVTGAGSTWANTRSLYLGFAGRENSLSIANGASVRATNLVVGLFPQSTNNLLSLSAAGLIVTNPAGTARMDLRHGTLALTNGTVRTAMLLVATNAEVVGTGTITANSVTNSGVLSPGNPAGQLNIGGNVTLKSDSLLNFELGGYNRGITHDFLNISNSIALGGVLAVRFSGGFERTITNGATFTLLTAGAITGSLRNAGNGSRLLTADGFADFLVTYSGGNLVLSQPRLDFDHDGLPNWWELAFGFDPNAPGDAAQDADGDGLTNGQEYQAGTNPTNASSALRITAVIPEANGVRVVWTTVGGKSYILQAAGDATNSSITPSFFDLSPPITVPGTGESTTNFLHPGAAFEAPARFYRVRLAP